MSWPLVLVVVVAAVTAVSASNYDRQCSELEESSDCANACIATCARPKPGYCMISPPYCRKGCKCKPGYVRPFKDSSDCVEEGACMNEVFTSEEDNSSAEHCEENEEPSKCANACIRTCADPDPESCTIDDPDECQKGCKCKPSFVRRRGVCIRVEDCPNEFLLTNSGEEIQTVNECADNQQPSECVNACVATCANPQPKNCIIHEEFCAEGCECKPGYVRPSHGSDECILRENCSLPVVDEPWQEWP